MQEAQDNAVGAIVGEVEQCRRCCHRISWAMHSALSHETSTDAVGVEVAQHRAWMQTHGWISRRNHLCSGEDVALAERKEELGFSGTLIERRGKQNSLEWVCDMLEGFDERCLNLDVISFYKATEMLIQVATQVENSSFEVFCHIISCKDDLDSYPLVIQESESIVGNDDASRPSRLFDKSFISQIQR
ncbi:hypothetical protein KSP40_PGU004494 [Platanthera guangdongensis]|uniref:Uncharacterized protein n=1 Tax=Platanthera guangdongensis TaxID=2320717 RepID=A0ABR2MZD0_9ASPA